MRTTRRKRDRREPFGLAEIYLGSRTGAWTRWYATERQRDDALRGLKRGGWWSQGWIEGHFVGPVSRLTSTPPKVG